ncbi:MAG: UvrD-helicase domain-containing protein, partial [Sphaerochaetaceae bacterium]|nr:UvrD-helicase domain-containing protein [Sphaerochaetaceae bacterium]
MMDRLAFSESLASLNDEQLDAVSCDVNCVVTAGAGSGKTTVLAHRFFRLVAEGKAHADEILTLTFSRLAAAEMFERIHAKLHEYRDDPDIREELNRFGEATITTIDAFCNRIVASDPLRYGIGADFRLDEEENRRMATECATNLCTRMDGHAGLMFLASLYNPEELVSSLFAGLCIKWFHPASTFDPQMMTGLLTEQIELLYGEQLAAVLDSCQLI